MKVSVSFLALVLALSASILAHAEMPDGSKRVCLFNVIKPVYGYSTDGQRVRVFSELVYSQLTESFAGNSGGAGYFKIDANSHFVVSAGWGESHKETSITLWAVETAEHKIIKEVRKKGTGIVGVSLAHEEHEAYVMCQVVTVGEK